MKSALALVLLGMSALAQQPQQSAPTTEVQKAAEAAAKAALQEAAKSPQQPGTPKPATPAAPQAAPQPTQISLMSLPAEQVVATVDGKSVTAGQLQAILRTLQPAQQQAALADRRRFVEQFGVLRRLSEEAEKEKLDQTSPWKEAIDNARMMVLWQATINDKMNRTEVTADEQKAFYEKNKDRYAQARVKAIYIPFITVAASQPDPSGKKLLAESEAKAKAEGLVKEIRGGADFVKLVKEHSGDATSAAKDGDFGTIRRTDQLPEPIKTAVFATKAGEVTEPLRQASGYYIFRVEEPGTQSFEEVQSSIANELRSIKFGQWMDGLRKSLDIKMAGETSAAPSSEPPVVFKPVK